MRGLGMKIDSRFWITKDSKNYLGVGRIELLERIKASGSIAKAAKQMKMSYKAAWDSIDIANKLSAPNPLVISNAGGGKDSGTQITQEGQKAIDTFKNLQILKNEFFSYLDDAKDFDELNERIQKLAQSLKTSTEF